MNASRAVLAGLVGTSAMTVVLLVAPRLGLEEMAIGELLSTVLAVSVAALPIGPAAGWGLHFLFGVIFALAYAGVVVGRLPGAPVVRGALYGFCIFVLAQLVFMPAVGGGVFSRGDVRMLLGSLLGHLIYGGVVGELYGIPAVSGPAPSGRANA